METKLTDIEEIAQTDGKSAWLMVYADLTTLVMIFFHSFIFPHKNQYGTNNGLPQII